MNNTTLGLWGVGGRQGQVACVIQPRPMHRLHRPRRHSWGVEGDVDAVARTSDSVRAKHVETGGERAVIAAVAELDVDAGVRSQ